MNNFYTLVEEIKEEQKSGDISGEQWDAYDARLEQLTSECYEQYEAELNKQEQAQIVTCVGVYLYSKYGLMAAMELGKQEANIRKILAEIDYGVLLKTVKEVLENPDEMRKIMEDLRARYE